MSHTTVKTMNQKTIFTRQSAACGLLAASLLCSTIHLQAGAGSVMIDPIGVVGVTIPAGKTQALAIPLKATPVFAGDVSVWSSNTIKSTGASWAADSFAPFAGNPHVVRLLSGSGAGRYFRVLSQTADTLTLDTDVLLSLVALGDKYEIIPVDTLEEIFGVGGETVAADPDPAKADNVIVREGDQWVKYYNDGSQWLQVGGDGSPKNATAILPDQGVLFVRNASEPLDLTLSGEVPVDKLVTQLPADTTLLLANPFPVDITLNQLGLQKDSSWVTGASAAEADYVQIRVAQGWLTYFYDGTAWLQEGGGTTARNPVIPKGSSIVISRRAGPCIFHAQQPPY